MTRPGFLLASMIAWFSLDSVMTEGASLHASPSTCMGITFVVTIFAVLHWVMHVPCPPACSNGYEEQLLLFYSCYNRLQILQKRWVPTYFIQKLLYCISLSNIFIEHKKSSRV